MATLRFRRSGMKIEVNGFDLSPYISDVEVTVTRQSIDVTPIGSGYRQYLSDLAETTLSFSGNLDSNMVNALTGMGTSTYKSDGGHHFQPGPCEQCGKAGEEH